MAEDDEDSMTEVDVCRTHLSLLIRTLLLCKLGEGKYVLASFLFTTALGIDKAPLSENRLDLQPSCCVVIQGRIA